MLLDHGWSIQQIEKQEIGRVRIDTILQHPSRYSDKFAGLHFYD